MSPLRRTIPMSMKAQPGRYDMSNGQKLSGSGSNQSQPKIFPPETGSSDSSSALTVENVKRLENEYMTSKEAFTKQRIQDYIKQTNLACFNKETTRKTSTELVWNAEPGPSSSFPAKQSKNSKEVGWKTSEEISRKDKLLTVPTTDSPSDQPTGSQPKESKWCVDGYPAARMHDIKEAMTQTKWSYSNESLAAREEVMEVLSRDSKMYPEAGESKGTAENEKEAAAEDGEENNQAGLHEQGDFSSSTSQLGSHGMSEGVGGKKNLWFAEKTVEKGD
ncbi:glutamate-rich protein 6b [Limosa lapponica baueri]|uniref:Glutamate-rich protein 6b n=1 Tax=Limosa lapponica baueri TaxID=1758121 RepID=A0A2I0U1E4_LIMLA|nr:glutamate-rich protein 6b [Limosa lapponica baueri]